MWRSDRPLDLALTLRPLCRGYGDPSNRFRDGVFWRACRTPAGVATLALRQVSDGVAATVWGEGGEWVLDQLPSMLGEDDDWSGLDLTTQPRLADVRHRNRGMRLPRTNLVFDQVIPAILEQKVTNGQAHSAWRRLLWRHGEKAPGPLAELRLPPTAEALLAVPTWDWHRFEVDISRQRAVRAAATVALRLDECAQLAHEQARARLMNIPGIGVWTAAEVMQRAMGDPDAVSVGDFHLHDLVVFALSGQARGDDERMLELLSPWVGQRQRVVRLIELSGVRKPRFGPRYRPQDMRAF